MDVEQLIQYLRLNVNIVDPDTISGDLDPYYLTMTDDEILLYLNIVMTRDFPDTSLADLETENVYPVLLVARKDLLAAMMVKVARYIDMGADGAYLRLHQIFDSFKTLFQLADKDYTDYCDGIGAGDSAGLTAYDVLLPDRYYTRRYREKAATPALSLSIAEVGADYVNISWKAKNASPFFRYEVYVSDVQIVDLNQVKQKIADTATLLVKIKDFKQTNYTVGGLLPEQEYHVAVVVVSMSGLRGYIEKVVTTEAVVP